MSKQIARSALVAAVVVALTLGAASAAHAGCSGIHPAFYTTVECSPFQTIECYDQWVVTGAGGSGGYYCVCECVIMGGGNTDEVTCNTQANAEYWECIERAEADGQHYTADEAQLCRILAYLEKDKCYLGHA